MDNSTISLFAFNVLAMQMLSTYDFEKGEKLYFVWTDLPALSDYNEQNGFFAGDELLDTLVREIRTEFPTESIGVCGGTHYVFMASSSDYSDRLSRVNEAIRRIPGTPCMEMKAGVAQVIRVPKDLMELISRAHAACRSVYGRDRVVGIFAPEMERSLRLEAYVPAHFQEAMDKDEIKIVFQPIARGVTGRICMCETLARWEDPEFGFISPADFVPILEKKNLSSRLDAYILENAAKDLECARKNHKPNEICPISVNLTYNDLQEEDFFEVLESTVNRHNLPRSLFVLEIPEEVLNQATELVLEKALRFREAGYEVWLDQYQADYVSLAKLDENHFNGVKYDLHFIQELRSEKSEEEAAMILSYSVSLLKQKKISSLLMGVESKEEYELTREKGFEMIEGWYIGKPGSYEELFSSPRGIEDNRTRDYFYTIGSVYIDSSLALSDRQQKISGFTGIPTAICECQRRHISILYSNNAFLKYIRSMGIQDCEYCEFLTNRVSGVTQERLMEFSNALFRGQTDVHFSMMIRGVLVDGVGKSIAKNPITGSIAAIVRITDLTAGSRERLNDFEAAIQSVYMTYDRMDLVRRSDMVVMRSYVNSVDYWPIFEGQHFPTVISSSARESIKEEEQDSFMEFVNERTVDQRVRGKRRGMVAKTFHIRMDNGKYVEKRCRLMPLLIHGSRMLLFIVADVSEA